MSNYDFTDSKAGRPSAARIVAAWKRDGRPSRFTVEYGETFAEFEYIPPSGSFFAAGGEGWQDSGNGCRGVDRDAVVRALNAETSAENARRTNRGLTF